MDAEWKRRVMEASVAVIEDVVESSDLPANVESRFGSPIESAFALAAKVLIAVRYPEFKLDEDFGCDVSDIDAKLGCGFQKRPVWGVLAPHVIVGNHRVDFVIRYVFGLESAAGVIIECDGHAFHEKTKEQAARDKYRDRNLQSAGFHILRFSGSEIWKDPIACADQALYLAHARALDSVGARAARDRGDMASMQVHLKWMVQ